MQFILVGFEGHAWPATVILRLIVVHQLFLVKHPVVLRSWAGLDPSWLDTVDLWLSMAHSRIQCSLWHPLVCAAHQPPKHVPNRSQQVLASHRQDKSLQIPLVCLIFSTLQRSCESSTP